MQNGLLGAKTIKQAARLMKANVFTAPELIEETYKNIENAKVSTELSKSGFYPTVTAGYSLGSNVFFTNLTDTELILFTKM